MNLRHPASFRDPAGHVYTRDGTLYRQVNQRYRTTYDGVVGSGLLGELVENGLLVAHREVDVEPLDAATASLVIEPHQVPFVSYPYEWSPGQLRDAALATLEIQLRAMDHGYSLKDASAFNIQLLGGGPALIDTLSFEPYVEGRPWVAYGQFCRHFLAPLALARQVDPRLLTLAQTHLDGVPLDLATALLPRSSRLGWGLGVHLHAHASAQRKHAGDETAQPRRPLPAKALRGLIESLRATVRKQTWSPSRSAWSDYYAARESYSEDSMTRKRDTVVRCLAEASSRGSVETVWDLGANTGQFARLAAEATGATVVAFERDVSAVELHWQDRHPDVLPLVSDLTNPSPALGWAHHERASLLDRGPADLSMALALVHHLAIGNNVPLDEVVDLLSRTTRSFALLEWVPKSDPMVRRMLATREDVFDAYDETVFRRAVQARFEIVQEVRLDGSERTLFLLRRLG